jgi:Flp pilus assembly protein TadD
MSHPGLNAESLKRQAQAHFHARRVNEARTLFAEACRIDPSDAQAWHMLGVCCATLGDFAEAERSCRKAIELKPEVPVAHANLANVLVSLGRLDEAEISFRQALQLKPDDAPTYLLHANLLSRLERLPEAEAGYRAALMRDPHSAEAHNNLGVLLWKQGRQPEAVTCLRQAIALKPDYLEAYSSLGNMLMESLKMEEAEACYRAALRLSPENARIHSSLGKLMQIRGKFNEAQECYREALRLSPNFAEAYFNFGYLRWQENRFDDALAQFNKALACDPDYIQARLGQAVSLQHLGKMNEAFSLYRSMLGIEGDHENAVKLPAPYAAVAADKPAAPPGGYSDSIIPIATSIAPRNIENQRQVIESWKQLGFKVVSVNSHDEISVLKDQFPDVEFITAQRDARRRFGKPYVYFDDLLRYFRDSNYSICGIVNSDIHLRTDRRFTEFLRKEAIDSFIYGSRVEIPSLSGESMEGRFFLYGYDYFFFDRKFTYLYPEEEFCVGLPWVDYWAVLIPILRNEHVKKLTTPVGYHVSHALNWDEKSWESLSHSIAKYTGTRKTPPRRFLSIYAHYIHAIIETRSTKVILPDQ